MKPRANVAKTIEKMMKKLDMRWNQAHRVNQNGDFKMMIASPHWMYVLKEELLNGVNDAWIATKKEEQNNDIVTKRQWEKVIPDETLRHCSIVVEYSELRKMQVIETKYGTKIVKFAAAGNVIYLVLQNLIDTFRIFQEPELTIDLYKSPYSFRNPRIDKASGLEVNLQPCTIKANGNIFVGCPMLHGF